MGGLVGRRMTAVPHLSHPTKHEHRSQDEVEVLGVLSNGVELQHIVGRERIEIETLHARKDTKRRSRRFSVRSPLERTNEGAVNIPHGYVSTY